MIFSSYTGSLIVSDFTVLKIYPVVLLFLFFYRLKQCCKLSFSKNDLLFCFIIISFVTGLINSASANSIFYTAKNLINFAFFHQSVRLAVNERENPNRFVALIFFLIFIAFLQLLYLVEKNGLWLYPINIINSASSEIINDLPKVIGVNPKNIWASQLVFVIVIYTASVLLKRVRFSYVTYVIYAMYIFTQFYLASRVAQISSIILCYVAWIGLFFNFYPLKIKRSYLLLALALLLFLTYFYFDLQFQRLASSSIQNLNSGHSGDGFKQRIIIYITYVKNMGSLEFFDLIFGVGVSGISNQTFWTFPESNLHNVFLSVFSDFGLFGLIFYVLYFYTFLKNCINHVGNYYLVLLAPAFFVMMFQYQGFDIDLLWFFAAYLMVSQMNVLKISRYDSDIV